MPYRHLTPHEREVIGQMASAGESLAAIGAVVNRHKSTISREIRRNSVSLGEGVGRLYLAFEAQHLAQRRRHDAQRKLKLDDERLRERVHQYLRQAWSPEQITKVLKQEDRQLSHETIYAHIQRDFHAGGKLYRFLRRRHRERCKRCSHRRSRIVGRVSIHERPKEVEQRIEPGHWEGDTLLGPGGRIVTLVERVSRYLIAIKVADGRSATVIQAIRGRLRRLPADLRRTLTTDNGSEFSEHWRLRKRLGLAVYFADPHSPWQRGSNENANGLLRQFIPKGSDLRELSRQRLAQMVKLLNNRPRKVLNYQTPATVLRKPPDIPRSVALQT